MQSILLLRILLKKLNYFAIIGVDKRILKVENLEIVHLKIIFTQAFNCPVSLFLISKLTAFYTLTKFHHLLEVDTQNTK